MLFGVHWLLQDMNVRVIVNVEAMYLARPPFHNFQPGILQYFTIWHSLNINVSHWGSDNTDNIAKENDGFSILKSWENVIAHCCIKGRKVLALLWRIYHADMLASLNSLFSYRIRIK